MSDVVYNLAVNDAEYRRGIKRAEAETMAGLGRVGASIEAKTANVRKFTGALSSAAGAVTGMLGVLSAAGAAMGLLVAAGNAFAASQERAAVAANKQREAMVAALSAASQVRRASLVRTGAVGPRAASVADVNARFTQAALDLQTRQGEIEDGGITPRSVRQINAIRDEQLVLEAQRRREVSFVRQQALLGEFVDTRSGEAAALTAEGRGRDAQRVQLEVLQAQRLNQIRTQAEPRARQVLEEKLRREFAGRNAGLDRGFAREDAAAVAAGRIAALQAEGREIAALRAAEGERHRQALDAIEDRKRAGASGVAELQNAEARRHRAEMENIDREAAGRARARRIARGVNLLEDQRLEARALRAEGRTGEADRLDIATERVDLLRRVGEDDSLSPTEKRRRIALINRYSAARLAGLGGDAADGASFLTAAGRAGGAVAQRVFATTESERVNVQKQNTDALQNLTRAADRVVERLRDGVVGVFG